MYVCAITPLIPTYMYVCHKHMQYTGDPVSLAIADAVLTAVEEEGLQDHARKLGGYILSELRKMARDHPCIGDVRLLDLCMYMYMYVIYRPCTCTCIYIVQRLHCVCHL